MMLLDCSSSIFFDGLCVEWSGLEQQVYGATMCAPSDAWQIKISSLSPVWA